MRRDILQMRRFYASALGAAAREMIARKLAEAWGDARDLDLLGVGYATPYLEGFRATARRAIAAMPGLQGVEVWPHAGRNLALLGDEYALPFTNGQFERVLCVHALEESDRPSALLDEAWRVLAPSGRLIVVAADRRGLWSNAETTPFGHGRPYTRGQLEALVREAQFEPIAWSRALYVPPAPQLMRWREGFELVGSRVMPAFAGVILMEAVKQTYAMTLRPVHARVPAPRGGLLQPQAATRR